MISFRIAMMEDIPELCQLLSLLFEQEEEFMPNKDLQAKALAMIIDVPSLGHILIAEDDGMPVAMLNLLYTVSTALGCKVGMVEDMIVSPRYRDDGIGSDLLNYAVIFAKERGLKRLTLLTDKMNEEAHNFYLKNGFSSSGMIPFRKII